MQTATGPGRPAHVGAASGLVKVGSTLWVVSDDENFAAAFDGDAKGRWVRVLPGELPADREARRGVKPDFEALVAMPGGLLAVPSGSAPNRTKGAFLPDGGGDAKVVDLAPLLKALGARIEKLNVEGAAVAGDRLKLFHRGDAIVDLDLAGVVRAISAGEPLGADLILDVTHVALGTLGGVKLGFSDASPLSDGSIVFVASAEDTDDPTRDGAVTGSVVGVLGPGGEVRGRFPVKDLKLEGVHAERQGDEVRLLLVSDADDPLRPAPLLRAVLRGCRGVRDQCVAAPASGGS